jgi:hypothetical protein
MNTTSPQGTTARRSASLVALRPGFWRVVHPAGHVLGYVEEMRTGPTRQFAARRLVTNTTRLVDIGEFWSMEGARACFV